MAVLSSRGLLTDSVGQNAENTANGATPKLTVGFLTGLYHALDGDG